MVEAICKNNTCYLCTEKHRENGREHRENTGKTQGIESKPERGHSEVIRMHVWYGAAVPACAVLCKLLTPYWGYGHMNVIAS